jgi:Fe-S cluster assembly iron-binding protein IscA
VRVTITDEAVELLNRSLDMAGVDRSTGGVRLRVARALGGGVEVQVELAEALGSGDELVEFEGVRLFVDPTLPAVVPDPVITVEPMHDQVVVRPATN